MALTKETIVDKIEVLEMGEVGVRTATRIKEDGVELSSSFHRHYLGHFRALLAVHYFYPILLCLLF